MTRHANFKRRVRARAAKTGESYTAALAHLRQSSPRTLDPASVRLAVVQSAACDDPGDATALKHCGEGLREMMRQAHAQGARLIHFPEGAICAPGKRRMSSRGPAEIAEANWARADWAALGQELDSIAELARSLGVWAVVGSVHPVPGQQRPFNSLYVISEHGEIATRYDERLLSHTKQSYMYAHGSGPATFTVDGLRFGCALGTETHFPEIFTDYESLEVDCVLCSTTGGTCADSAFAAEALGHAASNAYWVSLSLHAAHSEMVPSGVAGPEGRWAARCADNGTPAIALADITPTAGGPARPWRRKLRAEMATSQAQ
ncbi:carbon-nitrogen hydrolase family protein [Hoeflea olei]|uniref:Amidohydrolase n=1 Tax=Hoeflea olei TaxID=1480615 RepID=A0A1C1YXP2_9HYPH|nr:carbon-nitrogen hydrolase family protein [Hoeflea olei]OCW58245.1 amidohydrolase [Hoeflea olei]